MNAPPLLVAGLYMLDGLPDPGGWINALQARGVTGVEHPVAGLNAAHLHSALPNDWDVVLTTVSLVVERHAADGRYGLASADEEGRAAAVNDVVEALGTAAELDGMAGRRRTRTIEVHAAVDASGGDRRSLRRSLEEIVEFPSNTLLTLEHCDAAIPGRHAAKGYLPWADELAEIVAVHGTGRWGIGVNWGRSAIDGRSATTPVEHAREAESAGVLTTAMISGASAVDGPWGPAWSDTHIPPRGDAPALQPSANSLLGAAELEEFVKATAGVPIMGVKVSARPKDTPPRQRLAVLEESIEMLTAAIKSREF